VLTKEALPWSAFCIKALLISREGKASCLALIVDVGGI
jgi:hypothetical protein